MRDQSHDGLPPSPLLDWLFDRVLDVAAEADVPVAVHTGYWGDFRTIDCKNLLPLVMRRRDVRFDMFHLGLAVDGNDAYVAWTSSLFDAPNGDVLFDQIANANIPEPATLALIVLGSIGLMRRRRR